MKTRELLSVLFVAAAAMFFASCSESAVGVDEIIGDAEQIKSMELAEAFGDSCDFTGALTEEEIAGLLEMREEEKLAGDVYRALYEVHAHVVFLNISKSEDAHTSAVLHLLNGFGLEDPASDVEGEFFDPLFTKLYAELTEQGKASLAEALKVGAFIEEYDIADLERLIEDTENETIQRVYGNLLSASKFHLKAFTNVLKTIGESYTPTVISEEKYQDILNSDTADKKDTDSDFTPGTGVCDGTGPNS